MSEPSRLTAPARGALGTSSCMRFRILRKVDLPQPDGPMSAVTFRGSISRLTRSSTLLDPNQALRFVARSDAGPPGGSLVPDGAGPAGYERWSIVVMGTLQSAAALAAGSRERRTRWS